MLEQMAEMVREDAGKWNNMPCLTEMPCLTCDYAGKNDCTAIFHDGSCPSLITSEGSLMFARKAVLLVARALEKWVSEIDRTNGVDLGDVEALGSEFMDLYYEVKKAEAKEAAHE